MGCCSLRTNRSCLEERSTKKQKPFRSDIYVNPTQILNIKDISIEEDKQDSDKEIEAQQKKNLEINFGEKHIEDKFSPMEAETINKNTEAYASEDYKSQVSFKDFVTKSKSSASDKKYTYSNSRSLKTFENNIFENKQNGGVRSSEANIDNENNFENNFLNSEGNFLMKIRVLSLKALNDQVFTSLNIDLQNEAFFNTNYFFVISVNFNNYVYYLFSDNLPNAHETSLHLSSLSSTPNIGFVNKNTSSPIIATRNSLPENRECATSQYNNKDVNLNMYNNSNIYNEKQALEKRNEFQSKHNGPFKKENTKSKTEINNIKEEFDDASDTSRSNSKHNTKFSFSPNKNHKSSLYMNSSITNNSNKFSIFTFENDNISSLNFSINGKEFINHYLSFHIFMSNRKIPENSFLVGESFLPVEFFKTNIDFNDITFEIPITNKVDHATIAYLSFNCSTKETFAKRSKAHMRNNSCISFSGNSSHSNNKAIDYLKLSVKYFCKYQILKLNQYDNNILRKLGLLNVINSLEISNIKIKFVDVLKKYAIENKKTEALVELNDILRENPFNPGLEISDLSIENGKNASRLVDIEKNIKKIIAKLDFVTISFTKYFAFLSMLNESLVDLNDRSSLIINSNFIYERIIYNPFTKCEEKMLKEKKFENMVIADVLFSLLLNLKKVSSNSNNPVVKFDAFYNDCIFIFRDLGNFFLSAKSNLLYFIKENSYHRTSSHNKIDSKEPQRNSLIKKVFISSSSLSSFMNINNNPINNQNNNEVQTVNINWNKTQKRNSKSFEGGLEESGIEEFMNSNFFSNFNNFNLNFDENIYFVFDKKEDCFYYLNYNVTLKYIQILINMIDFHIKALKDNPDNKGILIKVDSLIENLKNNMELYIIKKLDEISLKDINLATAILNLIFSFAKLAQNFSTLRGFSRVEFYLNFLVDEYSFISNWLTAAFKKFYCANKFYKIFIEMTELILGNSPLLFCHYMLQIINLRQIFMKFLLDAKNFDSKKFPFWITYMKFLFHLINNCKSDQCKMSDFYYINHEDFCNHYCDIFAIFINYTYFKPYSSYYIYFDEKKLRIMANFYSSSNNKSSLANINRNSSMKYNQRALDDTSSIYMKTESDNPNNKFKVNINLNNKENDLESNVYLNTDVDNCYPMKIKRNNNNERIETESTKNATGPSSFNKFGLSKNGLNLNQSVPTQIISTKPSQISSNNFENLITERETTNLGKSSHILTLNSATLSNLKKFMSTNQSVLLVMKFIDIFAEIVMRKYIFNIFKNKHKYILDKIIEYLFYLTFYNFEFNPNKHEFNDLKLLYFNLFGKILKIFYTLSENYKLDLDSLMRMSLKNIFKKNSRNSLSQTLDYTDLRSESDKNFDFDTLPKNNFADKLFENILYFRNEKSQKNDKNFIIIEKLLNRLKKL